MSEVKKVVLAYSGGLDTSIIIPWLKEHYNNCEVIAVCGNVGQKGELEGLEERAKASGASKLYIEDLTDEFVEDYVIPADPEKWYEERGFVPNVCFPCATLQDADTGRIALYYGCADSYVGLAFTTVDEVVDYIKTHDNAGPTDHEVGIR